MKKINPLILLVPIAIAVVLVLTILKLCKKTGVKNWGWGKITSPIWILVGVVAFKKYWEFKDE